jgi:hypothetical protein
MNEMYGAFIELRWYGKKYFETVTVPLYLRIPYALVRDWNQAFGDISQQLSAMTT